MTQVNASSARPVNPARSSANGPQRTDPPLGDVKAMREALDAARTRLGSGKGALSGTHGKGALPDEKGKALAQAAHGDAPAVGERAAFDDPRETLLRQARERQEQQDGLAGFGGMAQAQAAPNMPAMPAAHVDPAAFAQLLADLWTRENGKGAKEVTVSFGDQAWPATGATLVRNAAGMLDVSLHLGDPAASYGDTLDALAGQLREAGVALGSLSAV